MLLNTDKFILNLSASKTTWNPKFLKPIYRWQSKHSASQHDHGALRL